MGLVPSYHNGNFWEFLSKMYLIQISILGNNKKNIQKIMALLFYHLLKLK